MRWLIHPFWNTEERRLRALFRLAIQFGLFAAFSSVVGMAFAKAHEAIDANAEANFALGGLFMVATFVALVSVWVGRHHLDRRALETLGLRVDARWVLDFGFGIALGAILMLGILGVEYASGWASYEPIGEMGGDVPRYAYGPMALIAFLGVAIYEELLFRGYQLVNLSDGLRSRWIGPKAAVLLAAVLSSCAFGLAHFWNPGAGIVSSLNIAAAGLMLSAGFLATGELAIPMGLHLGWNFFQNFFGMPVSGQERFFFAAALQREALGPEWVTGGVFGPEARHAGLGAMVVGTLATLVWVRIFDGRLGIHPSLLVDRRRLLEASASEPAELAAEPAVGPRAAVDDRSPTG